MDLKGVLNSVIALSGAIGLALGVVSLSGGRPAEVLEALVFGAFGTRMNMASTLVKSVPLLLTGLSVAVAFRAGLFNIGGEGQLYAGAISAAWIGGLHLGLPGPLYVTLVLAVSCVAGGLWGALPGWLKAKRGVHEVINTILLNHIAIQATDYLVSGPLKAGDYATRTRDIAVEAELPVLWHTAPIDVSWGLVLAIFACTVSTWLLFRTATGYNLRAVGECEKAASFVGISTKRMTVGTMGLAGGLAGIAGGIEVTGVHHTFYAQFSPGYGFDGIAVALLARNHPMGVIPAALLFGALRTADRWLQLSVGVPRDLVVIIQAATIFVVGIQGVFKNRRDV